MSLKGRSGLGRAVAAIALVVAGCLGQAQPHAEAPSSSLATPTSGSPSGSPQAAEPTVTPATPTPAPAAITANVRGWHVPVLMYHHVGVGAELGSDLHKAWLNVPPALFDAQMARLHAAGWTTITAAALGQDLELGVRPPGKTVVITFDDGHEDGYVNAFPALVANGFVATFYVITAQVGSGEALRIPEVSALASDGMEIADHTVHHVPLALVPPAEAAIEITGAAVWIDSLLGAWPTTLAYPYGNENAVVVADVREAGFTIAFTNREGCFESTATRFVVPRIRVGPGTTPAALLAAVSGCGYP